MNNSMTTLSRLLLFITGIMLVISIFVPIWRIELNAPQYPEGLMMQIFSNKLGGQVDIINGLNHYIGMQTLHAENFIEFTILPYIIGSYALLIFVAGLIGKKKWLYFTFIAFVVFGIVAMADFWRWEYNYGHNLDPSAAIIVPGMSYQPPLIGFKQLLNFGAYSVPDIGGWLFVAGGLLMVLAVMIEKGVFDKLRKIEIKASPLLILLLALASCNNNVSEPVKLNIDNCDYCKMTIADGRFAAEIKTDKGRVHKFDDLHCLLAYKQENVNTVFTADFVNDYKANNKLIDASASYYIVHPELKSPMGGNTAAFSSKDDAAKLAKEWNVQVLVWTDIMK